VDAQNRAEQFAEAVQSVRHWATPEIALQAAGIRPETATPDELARLAEAEREAIDEAIGMVREAAKTDSVAADWLRSRGIALDG
jgi:hypothetical protein